MFAAGVDWSSVGAAGAFVVGAIAATIATIWLTKIIRQQEHDRDR